jgi:hypothetical protein
MNSTRSIGGTIPISLTHWSRCVRTGSSSSNWYLSTRMGPNPFVPFQHAPMGCNVHVTTHGWIQPQYWNYPHFFETLSRYCTYRLFQLQLFWYLSTRMGPNPFVPFQHAQWVVTYMWLLVDEFNSQYWWNYPHFFESLEGRCTYRLFQLNYFGIFHLGWALPFVPFSMLNGL